MSQNESYKIYTDGSDFQQEYLKLIRSAEKSITLHSYIFQLDVFGIKVKELLEEKARQGVKVEIFLDYLGSFHLPDKIFEDIENLKFKYFNIFSFPKLLRIGRRLHYKVLIVDTQVAFVGGINVIDGVDARHPDHPRLDFAVRVEGDVVTDLERYCSMIFSASDYEALNVEGRRISFKVNDWLKERKQITSSYYELIKGASKEIVLIHGYFFPSFTILKHLKKKSREGVSVVIILPKYSDWRTWIWASEHLYGSLLKNNVKVLEWEHSKLHGKMAIFDEKLITLGSHNLNYTSSYGNLEINIEINDEPFAKGLRGGLVQKIIEGSSEVTVQSRRKVGIFSKLRNLLFYSMLMTIAAFSVNYIKLSYQLTKMKPFQLMFLGALIFVGIVGVFAPILPGIPFFIAAILFYMRVSTPQSLDLRP